MDERETSAWVRLAALVELLPGALDSQLRRDAGLSHFEYSALRVLAEAPDGYLRMSALAARTSATLPRLSHVIARLEKSGLVERRACPEDGRASNASLTEAGLAAYREAQPGHVATVRRLVLDVLSPEQLDQAADIAEAILREIDPEGSMTALCRQHQAVGTPA
jgi:DNA-binding MarR family transcriptional regulator